MHYVRYECFRKILCGPLNKRCFQRLFGTPFVRYERLRNVFLMAQCKHKNCFNKNGHIRNMYT